MDSREEKRAEWRRLFDERYKGRLAIKLMTRLTAPLFFVFFATGLYYELSPQTAVGGDIFEAISPYLAVLFFGNILWAVIANILASTKSGFFPRRGVGGDNDGT